MATSSANGLPVYVNIWWIAILRTNQDGCSYCFIFMIPSKIVSSVCAWVTHLLPLVVSQQDSIPPYDFPHVDNAFYALRCVVGITSDSFRESMEKHCDIYPIPLFIYTIVFLREKVSYSLKSVWDSRFLFQKNAILYCHTCCWVH